MRMWEKELGLSFAHIQLSKLDRLRERYVVPIQKPRINERRGPHNFTYSSYS